MNRFADVSALTPVDEGRFRAHLHPNWSIGGKPNGGYLLALLGRAATLIGPHRHVVAASAHFLRSPDPGEVEVRAELLRGGRSASQVRARLHAGGQACVEALITTTDLAPDSEPYWSGGLPDPFPSDLFPDGPADRDAALRVPGVNPAGVPVPIMEEVDLRIDRAAAGFADGRGPSGRGELFGWLSLADDEPFDPVSLLYAIDAFPPATFEVELTGWVPTLELTVHVRALPAPGPLRVLQRAGLVDGQRVDEACWAWDSRGRVVAHGVQLAGVRLG
ncbi:thioesterase family protein [Jatrophihabitans fulvus]